MIKTIERMMQQQTQDIQRLKRDVEMMRKKLEAFYQTSPDLIYRVINLALLCGAVLNLWVAVGTLVTQSVIFNSRFQAFIALLHVIAIILFSGYQRLQKRRRGAVYLVLADIHSRQLKALTMSELLIRLGEELLLALEALKKFSEQEDAYLLYGKITTKFNRFCQFYSSNHKFFTRLQHDTSEFLKRHGNQSD
jgi:hypothetical protein